LFKTKSISYSIIDTKMLFVCRSARAVKWDSLRSYWLSAFVGSNPTPCIYRKIFKGLILRGFMVAANFKKNYYELFYQKTMIASKAKKLLEGLEVLTFEGNEPQWGLFDESALMSFVGGNGINYKCRATRTCEEGKSIDKGNNKVGLGFLLYDASLIKPLEDKVIREWGFEKVNK
jgi:hypothetical protein